MHRRALLVALMACAATALRPAYASDKVNVVATFSILADFVRNVGGDRVEVTALVGPGADAHVYTPSPSDAKKIAAAKLVVVNGLGLEGWLPRLVKSSGGTATTLVASSGITPLRPGGGHHAEADPHAWQSVANAKIYVGNIRDALMTADPDGAATYRSNAEQYLARLDALDREVREAVAQIPPERRKVISSHEAFGYFAAAYGIAFVAPQGVSTESEPSARDLATIIRQIRKENIPAVFLENISDPRLVERIAAETGARIGGTLYSDSLTGEKGDAPTYIDMVRHNIRAVSSALKS
ncbi:MAG: ABC transporter substrate-binding protein [Rhizobiales bacterium 62-47]|nr:metal ABC transporter substrate-binding protein [Hyphomicrobiales bacterium]OJY10997.1 MAG: ABC transporter substrate-binding protein [Rhizobiales bacterium 62-47]